MATENLIIGINKTDPLLSIDSDLQTEIAGFADAKIYFDPDTLTGKHSVTLNFENRSYTFNLIGR
ncbi:hypothetical protein [Citrobacter portucalensis]|uniref:hypothetical protein n=1 Tax=Citrobacter portucalensis TaxID=1639133 RepID=UPI00226B96AC|nr:hypothetical protein [Citrobacter portucalensis]MCX9047067.1 hypothetical protein [Citrobacter portucalensis]